jgi:hypothetical protein
VATSATASKIRLAEHAPPACASCFSQRPDAPHVDFGAYYDGPVLDGAKHMQIDDLVICEQCLTEAASLVGLTRQEDLEERLKNAGQRLAESEARNEAQAEHIVDLQKAIASKPPARKKA